MDSFYKAFEDRHRGSRELIAGRLQVYLPFIRPLVAQRVDAIALDLGCGRGEWLDLTSSEGFHAQGVDLDEGMLAACHERGMDVQQRDALDMLRSLPGESVSVVSAFHVVEHISFDDVRELIAEAMRVLVPGGVLIMETPNPENIVVAGSLFYMDPTHRHPLPPPLLSFAAEYARFERVKTLRLQEPESLHDPAAAISLLNVLEGVSPDYSVVAQKGGDELLLASTAPAFEKEYGLTLPALAIRHTQYAEARLLQIEANLRDALARTTLAEDMVGQARDEAQDAQREAHEAQREAHEAQREAHEAQREGREAREGLEARVLRAEALAHEYFLQLEAVHASTSWRVTAPLRGVGTVVHALRRNATKSNAKRALGRAALHVRRQPWLAGPALILLNRFPRLKRRLTLIATGFEVQPTQPGAVIPSDAVHLTPHARDIYSGLKFAVERRQKQEG
ncbi:class I SAM-dependent methyltransferase [Paraburkholderia heleia]|uniref:class I SAM-dependent methyltransferase n=1 Tax=Paraburkholderia heleia TaxID=634127 RepID=UPI0031D4DC7B